MHATCRRAHGVPQRSTEAVDLTEIPCASFRDHPALPRLALKIPVVSLKVKIRPRRRHTLPLATKGEMVHKQEFLPGRGRRTSLFGTAYDPAALFLR